MRMVLGVGEKGATVRDECVQTFKFIQTICEDCLKLTKAMQKTSETFQTVADLYEDHVSD